MSGVAGHLETKDSVRVVGISVEVVSRQLWEAAVASLVTGVLKLVA
jgi:hypothetical protein